MVSSRNKIGTLHEILDSDNDIEQDDLSSGGKCESIGYEFYKGDEGLEHQSVQRIMQHMDSESDSYSYVATLYIVIYVLQKNNICSLNGKLRMILGITG